MNVIGELMIDWLTICFIAAVAVGIILANT